MTGIERLRELSKGMHNHRITVWQLTDDAYEERFGVTKHGPTIKNFLSDIADQIERESDVETVRSDAMEAWRWVCDHGGLPHVKDIYNDLRAVVERLGVEWSESELHGLMDALDRRLMPEGVEWPRYEDGEPVRIGGSIADGLGRAHEVSSVEVFDDAAALHWNPDEPEERVWVGHGERARRPAVLAADGEPLEVGQTVYAMHYGYVKCTVLAIEWVVDGYLVEVENEGGHKFRQTPDEFTHQRPVLDADGVPIKVGDTVWHEDGTELRVLGFGDEEDGETIVRVDYVDGPTDWSEVRSLSLTHAKPEPPDSYCRLYADMAGRNGNARIPNGLSFGDFVRRCRALAERERGE